MPVGTPHPAAVSVPDLADLLGAIAWPLVVLALGLVLRQPLRLLVTRIGTSASSLSIGPGGVKVDFGSAVRQAAPEAATVLSDLRSPAPGLADSAAPTMFAELATEQPAPQLVVDLGEGKEWLSSRLFLFAVLLARMRRTRTLIFVATINGVSGRFVGLGSPVAVRFALGQRYPRLEAEYARAYTAATTRWQPTSQLPRDEPLILDHRGRLAEPVAQQLVRDFLHNIKVRSNPPFTEEWVDEAVPGGQINEHAEWLTALDAERILGGALERWAYLTETGPRTASETGVLALRMSGHDTVAIVDELRRFKGTVVDRRRALEQLAEQAAAPADEN